MIKSDDFGFTHVFAPSADPARTRTLLLLHGSGADERDLLDLGARIAPGASLLSPRGQVTEDGKTRFFRMSGPGKPDVDDLTERAHRLAEFLSAAAARYGFDPANLAVLGYSNGATAAAAMLLLRPGLLPGAALLHPLLPFTPEEPPDLSGTRVFLAAGRNDPLIPAENSALLETMLGQCGADVRALWHDGGHAITPEEVAAAQEWAALI